MRDYPILDYIAWARENDPDTSHEAAACLNPDALAHLQRVVFDALLVHPEGLTTTEIARLGGLPRDSISPRMRTLSDARLVADSGERRVPEGMRRRSIVWKLTAPGPEAHG